MNICLSVFFEFVRNLLLVRIQADLPRAEKNIDEIPENLNQTFDRLRQSDIDVELFDVLSSFNDLN
ncbi:MAG: F0F1-type ATP synthase gamma subunit [Psychromonas sp.]